MKDCVEVVNVVAKCTAAMGHVVLLSPFVSDDEKISKAVAAVKTLESRIFLIRLGELKGTLSAPMCKSRKQEVSMAEDGGRMPRGPTDNIFYVLGYGGALAILVGVGLIVAASLGLLH
jgi:hypothetical protein